MMTISLLVAAVVTTQSFREEHAQVRAHLEEIADVVGGLTRARNPKPKATQVLAFFEEHIAPHAAAEEQKLYPLIDRLAGSADPNRFTSTMRQEHRIVGRWIHLLQVHLASGDWTAFARRADNLIGLLSAHFEEEEEVLLPYADRSMSKAEFEELMAH
jgi:hemerythrin-like domain-containing protein